MTQRPGGAVCVVRGAEDDLYGPVVAFGLGGDATELLGDVSHRITPLTAADVSDMVRSVRAAPRLLGHRGLPVVDVAALAWTRPDAPPHARLRGLDPARHYRVRALTVGEMPRHLSPPAWCTDDGIVVRGSALMAVGLQVPSMHPEHSLLVHLVAVD